MEIGIVVVGDSRAGKTSLINRYCENTFAELSPTEYLDSKKVTKVISGKEVNVTLVCF